ncbi:MAG: O-antigen ligase family protein [Candidatus Eisenbacteria bacterium]
MTGLRRGAREVWDRGDDQMRRHWPVWVLGLAFYGIVGLLLLTRVRIPSPLHLVVFAMAALVLSVTSVRIEWGLLALVIILPFGRPGITVGNPKMFHISGFNFALVGVMFAYMLRYLVDAQFARLGPLIRRTRIDRNLFAFGLLVLLSCFWSFNLNKAPTVNMNTALFLKEQVLYIVWFYLLVTLLRKPKDLRQFAMFFAVAGLMTSLIGMATRLMGGAAAITPGTIGENLEGGAGGRIQGGWLGLGHPNMFAALLLMTMPIWLFAVSHLKHGVRRLVAEVAVITGFLGLLFTYSRSAWLGSMLGIGLVGLADRKSLMRVLLFATIFVIIAQTVVLLTIDMNLIEVVVNRFKEFESSSFSGRPYIYAAAIRIVRAHPILGVGLGAFRVHAREASSMSWVPRNAHNVYLSYATESGIPAALLFSILVVRILLMSAGNVRAVGRVPGYGFIALGSCGAFIGLVAQTMFVQIFNHRILGFGFYALVAIVVAMDRMIRDGQFDEIESGEPGTRSVTSPWMES